MVAILALVAFLGDQTAPQRSWNGIERVTEKLVREWTASHPQPDHGYIVTNRPTQVPKFAWAFPPLGSMNAWVSLGRKKSAEKVMPTIHYNEPYKAKLYPAWIKLRRAWTGEVVWQTSIPSDAKEGSKAVRIGNGGSTWSTSHTFFVYPEEEVMLELTYRGQTHASPAFCIP